MKFLGQLCPILHNPVKKQIKVYKKLKVRIDFSGTEVISFVKNDSKKIFERIAVNGREYLKRVAEIRREQYKDDEYFDYLIVTVDDYLAAAEVSMSGYNDAFTHGLFDAIWPGTEMYSPKNTNPNPDPHDPIYTMGNVLDHALLVMEKSWSSSKSTYQLFHWHGDPAMEIWTAAPQAITVNHNDVVNVYEASFDISAMNITSGFILKSSATIIVMDDENIADDSILIYSGDNLDWDIGETELSVSILNKDGKGVDFVRSSGNSDEPPEGTVWTGEGVQLTKNSIFRVGNVDNDNKDDWAAADMATFNILNQDQSNGMFPKWFTLSPLESSVGAQSTENVASTFDATGLTLGTKISDTIFIYHNSPKEASPIVVACNLEVKHLIAPQAIPKTVDADQNIKVEITLEGTDDDGFIAGYEIVDDPLNGTVSLNSEKVTYKPDKNYFGPDSFSYRVVDNDGLYSEEAWVAIIVNKVTAILDGSNKEKILAGIVVDFAAVPNPINLEYGRSIFFLFTVNGSVEAELTVYDAVGNIVYTDVIPISQAIRDTKQLTWDLTNQSGRLVSGGTYLAILKLTHKNGILEVKKIKIGVYEN